MQTRSQRLAVWAIEQCQLSAWVYINRVPSPQCLCTRIRENPVAGNDVAPVTRVRLPIPGQATGELAGPRVSLTCTPCCIEAEHRPSITRTCLAVSWSRAVGNPIADPAFLAPAFFPRLLHLERLVAARGPTTDGVRKRVGSVSLQHHHRNLHGGAHARRNLCMPRA